MPNIFCIIIYILKSFFLKKEHCLVATQSKHLRDPPVEKCWSRDTSGVCSQLKLKGTAAFSKGAAPTLTLEMYDKLLKLKVKIRICWYVQEPEDLFETISQAMLNAVDRDAVSGMGVVVHVM